MLADAPEGSGDDLVHVSALLTEVHVSALVAQLVVAVDGLLQLVCRHAQQTGQFFDGVGLVGIDEVGEHALRVLHGTGDVLGHHLLRHGAVGVAHVVAVVDLAVPAQRAVRVVGIHVGTVVAGQILGDVAHVDKAGVLVAEALALHVDVQERFLVHQAGVEVVHHLGVAQIFHLCTCIDGHDVAVAGLLVLLLVEAVHIGAPALDHGLVVHVVAGGQNDALGSVELDVLAVFVLCDDAGHLAVLMHQLDGGGVEEGLQIGVLGLHVLQHSGQHVAHVLGLGADPRSKEVAVLIAEVVGVHAVLPHTCQVLTGAHVGEDLLLVVVQQVGGVLVAVHEAAVAVLGLVGQAGAVQVPHQGLFGVLDVGVQQAGISAPVAQAVGHVHPHLLARVGGLGLDDGGTAVALAHHDALLLQQSHMAAQFSCPAGSRHTGSTGTHNDHVKVLRLVRGDVAQLTDRGLHFLGGQSFGHNGLSFVGLGGGNGHALGLIDAALGSLFDGVGGDGSAGVAIHLAGLCIQDLLHHLIGDIGTVTLGFVCHIDLHIGNGICIEGHGHSDRRCGVDTGSSGAVGACGIGTGSSAGSGAARSCAVAAAGQQACGSCTQGSSAQEVATGNLFAHNRSPCLFFV